MPSNVLADSCSNPQTISILVTDTGSIKTPPKGSYNAVKTTFTGSTDPLNTSTTIDPLNWLPTQVVNKPFTFSILSLDSATGTILTNSTLDVNVSIINTPLWTGDETTDVELCHNAVSLDTEQVVALNGHKRVNATFTSLVATKSATIKIKYSDTNAACSRDVFAIRPDKFILTVGQDKELLTSATFYNFSLRAQQFNSPLSTTPDYNITTANTYLNNNNLDANKTIYNTDDTVSVPMLNGLLSFSLTPFNIINGSAIAPINFTDVGKVNIKVIDINWSNVDIDVDDTPSDCSPTGAYVCGDVNATFIPDHFSLNNAALFNTASGTFTYLSSDLNMSAGMGLTLVAANSANTTTQNFDYASWENPVDVSFTVPPISGMTGNKSEISTTQHLGFISGNKVILNTDINTSANLIFNYNRNNTTPVNPFRVNGSALTLNATSTYTSAAGITTNVLGTVSPNQNATFIYGRTHAPRQRFKGNRGTALIYYEAYCSGATCTKTLLPNGLGSSTTDDPRWFVNSSHIVRAGNLGTVSQKNVSKITVGATTGTNIASVPLTYSTSASAVNGYPYKATIENNASTWLIYDKYTSKTTNEFEVEFINANSSWAGKKETANTTDNTATQRTNRRSMW